MKKYIVISLLFAALLGGYMALRKGAGEPPSRIYRIGILVRGSGYEPAVEGYRRKMAELGYQEGKNVVYDVRFVTAREELPGIVEEFLAEEVDLIHTYSTPATQIAYQATKNRSPRTPIVFGSMGDPLISGVIHDIQRPGTNVTGVASLSTELTAQRLELLSRIKPGIKRVAMPHTSREAGDVAANKSVDIAEATAETLGIELILFPVASAKDNAAAALRISGENVEGMIVGGDSLVWGAIDVYIARAISEKIPLAAFDLAQVKKGALIGFGPDYAVSGEQAAVLSHQIFRGLSPAEIPVAVPRKLILAINRATERAIGVNIPDDILRKADVIIEGE